MICVHNDHIQPYLPPQKKQQQKNNNNNNNDKTTYFDTVTEKQLFKILKDWFNIAIGCI